MCGCGIPHWDHSSTCPASDTDRRMVIAISLPASFIARRVDLVPAVEAAVRAVTAPEVLQVPAAVAVGVEAAVSHAPPPPHAARRPPSRHGRIGTCAKRGRSISSIRRPYRNAREIVLEHEPHCQLNASSIAVEYLIPFCEIRVLRPEERA